MQRYILVRLVQAAITLFVVAVVVFTLVRLSGDPLPHMLPPEATEEDYTLLRGYLGLDKPVPTQFWIFLKQMTTGDFGLSLFSREPVIKIVLERLPNSLSLGITAFVIMIVMAFPLGVTAAVNRGKWIDVLARGLAAAGQSLPQFWIGLVLMQIFAIKLKLLPVAEMGNISTYILPGFVLSVYVLASVTRLLRSSMLDVLDLDFIRGARAKGVSEAVVIWKHALRNALIPVVTFAGLYLAVFIMGAVVVEMIFAWPGLGRLLIQGVMQRDYPVVQVVVLYMSILVVMVNLAIDILYAYIDPRIRYQKV